VADTIRELLVRLGVDAQDKNLKRFDKALGQVKRNMLVAAAAATGLTAGLAKIVYDVGAAGDAAAKTADKLGIAVEDLQELQFAAKRSGVDVRTLNMALQRMTRRMAEASKDTGEAKDAIKELGLDAKVLAKQGPAEILMAIAGAMENVTDDSQRLRLAFKLFDSEGVAVVNMLKNGEEGLAQLRQQARSLGYVLSEEAARDAEQFMDGLTDMKAVAGGLRNTIGSALIPEVNRLMRNFQDWYLANRDIIDQRMDEWAQKLANGLERVADLADRVDAVVESLGGWGVALSALGTGVGIGAAIKFLAPFVSMLTSAGGMAGLASSEVAALIFVLVTLAAQILLTVAFYAALVAVLEDVEVLFEGGKSAIGEWIVKNKDAAGVVGALSRNLEKFLVILRSMYLEMEKASDLSDVFTIKGTKLGEMWGKFGATLKSTVLPVLAAMDGFLSGILDSTIRVQEQLGWDMAGGRLYQPAAGGAPQSTTVQFGDTSIVFTHPVGGDPEKIKEVVGKEIDRRNRAALDALVPGSER